MSARQQMEIFLRYLSDPGFQSGVAEDFGVHRTTVTKTFSCVLEKVYEKVHHWVKFPSTPAELNEAREEWSIKYGFPTAIGAVDCTHVEIYKPRVFKDEYVNRKGKFTLNVQMTCNASEIITSVDAGWPGSVHDSRIWRRSGIQNILKEFNGAYCLLGDSGYPISPWLMTPFKPAEGAQEKHYNTVHARQRVIIERVFGQIKQRFPILQNRIRLDLEKIPKVIACCAALHNISKHLHDGWAYEDHRDEDADEGPRQEDAANEQNTRQLGQEKRDNILQILANAN